MSTLGTIASRMRTTWLNRPFRLFGRSTTLHVTAMPCAPAWPSDLLAHALREASNLELEWRWYANQMTDAAEREYCLARAQWINPHRSAAGRDATAL